MLSGGGLSHIGGVKLHHYRCCSTTQFCNPNVNKISVGSPSQNVFDCRKGRARLGFAVLVHFVLFHVHVTATTASQAKHDDRLLKSRLTQRKARRHCSGLSLCCQLECTSWAVSPASQTCCPLCYLLLNSPGPLEIGCFCCFSSSSFPSPPEAAPLDHETEITA